MLLLLLVVRASEAPATQLLRDVVLAAAALVAFGVIWAKAVLPIARLIGKAAQAAEVVLELPKWQSRVDTRLEVIEGALYGTDMIDSLPVRRRTDGVRGCPQDERKST